MAEDKIMKILVKVREQLAANDKIFNEHKKVLSHIYNGRNFTKEELNEFDNGYFSSFPPCEEGNVDQMKLKLHNMCNQAQFGRRTARKTTARKTTARKTTARKKTAKRKKY